MCMYAKEALFISFATVHDIVNNDLYILLKKISEVSITVIFIFF